MKTVTFTEFRKHASGLLTEVENGETYLVLRHGKPIAEISPPEHMEITIPSWKKPGLKITLKGKSLAQVILNEREVS